MYILLHMLAYFTALYLYYNIHSTKSILYNIVSMSEPKKENKLKILHYVLYYSCTGRWPLFLKHGCIVFGVSKFIIFIVKNLK